MVTFNSASVFNEGSEGRDGNAGLVYAGRTCPLPEDFGRRRVAGLRWSGVDGGVVGERCQGKMRSSSTNVSSDASRFWDSGDRGVCRGEDSESMSRVASGAGLL